MSVLYSRPARPVSLSLEQLVADNASEVTGRTSGYSTSNDSDLEEGRDMEYECGNELPFSREAQVKMRLSTPLMYLFSISVEYHSARLFVSHFNKVKEWKIEIELRKTITYL